jgi:hydroxyacylglutathione hydrolase
MPDLSPEVKPFILGPLLNNSYLVWDLATQEAVVIDPSFDPRPILTIIEDLNLSLRMILLTHAHFDHIAGLNDLFSRISPRPQIMIHEFELPLWKRQGAARQFGYELPSLPEPDRFLKDNDRLQVGNFFLNALFTPGHTPGHMVFHIVEIATVFTGDLIFYRGVGRTDMIGGNPGDLFSSIDRKILTLPPETRLLSGHGPATTVGDEKLNNPFI